MQSGASPTVLAGAASLLALLEEEKAAAVAAALAVHASESREATAFLQSRLQSLQQEYTDLQQEQEQLNQELARLRQDNDRIQQENGHLRLENHHLTSANPKNDAANYDELNERYSALQKQHDEFAASKNVEIDSLNNEISWLKARTQQTSRHEGSAFVEGEEVCVSLYLYVTCIDGEQVQSEQSALGFLSEMTPMPVSDVRS